MGATNVQRESHRSGAPQPMTALLGGAPLVSAGSMLHPRLGMVRYQIHEVSDDPDEQVAATIQLMKQYATEDAKSPAIQQDVQAALRTNDPVGDTFAHLSRGGARGMRFTQDEETGAPFQLDRWRPVIETLIRPRDLARMPAPQGDCDDFAMYAAAHLTARGVPCSFATVAADPSHPNEYSHVYLVAYPNGQRVSVDCSHGPYPGWEAGGLADRGRWTGKRKEWPLEGGSLLPILGFGVAAGAALWWLSKRRYN